MTTYNLKEIANKFARKQPKMVDDLTEKTPILMNVRWEPASHGLWNVAEKVYDITGPQFVDADAALPTMDTSSDLEKIDLTVLGGEMEVPEDTAQQFGGAAAYFARKQPRLFKQAGMDTERKLYYDNWQAQAIAESAITNATATTGGVYSLGFIRIEEGVNCGLFDPTQFDTGMLLRPAPINNASRYHLRSKTGVIGYGMTLKGRFGWQNLSNRTVHFILNIQAGKLPTELMIDDAITAVRGTPADTMIVCHPRCYNLVFPPFKSGRLFIPPQEKRYNNQVDNWNGIPILTSYNLYEGTETVTSFA